MSRSPLGAVPPIQTLVVVAMHMAVAAAIPADIVADKVRLFIVLAAIVCMVASLS
jgi:hypothetical protein